jgi:hypothetical protein
MYWSTPGPDLDRDGRGDFVVTGGVTSDETVWSYIMYETTGDDTYAPVWTHQVTGGWIHGGAAAGDIDGDGYNELACQCGGITQVLRRSGDNALEVIWEHGGPVVGQGEHRIVAPDLDGDGLGELIWWIDDNPGQAVVYEHTGTATFVAWPGEQSAGLELSARPVPFRQSAAIRYGALRADGSGPMRLEVFDMAGRLVRVLARGTPPASRHDVVWDGTDAAGYPVAAGVYFIRLNMGGESLTKGLVCIR